MDIAFTPQAETPYAKELEKALETQRRMFALLTSKVALCKERSKDMNLSEFDRVEAEISALRAEGELNMLEKIIRHKQRYFDEFMETFAKDLKECDERIQMLLGAASRSKNPKIRKVLDGRDLQAVMNEPQARVYLYKQLKEVMHG